MITIVDKPKNYIEVINKNFELFCNLKETFNKINEEFYIDVSNDDVAFLKDIAFLKSYTSSEKMLMFHNYIELISAVLFLKAINNSNLQCLTKIIQQPDIGNIKTDVARKMFEELDLITIDEASKILETVYPLFVNSISRKSSGMEYTQNSIVNFMLDEVGYKDDIIGKTILDPSCGSGAFLIPILDRAIARYKETRHSLTDLLNVFINEKLVVGIDINPCNVHISKLRYLLEIKKHFPDIEDATLINIYEQIPVFVGNTLRTLSIIENIPDYLLDSTYDFVVGNPPYIRLQRLPKQFREDIKRFFESATGRFDLYVCFIEKAIQLLRPMGKIAYITSNKFLTTNYGVGIRNYILKNLKIESLVDLNDTKFFEAAVLPVIIVGTREDTSSNYNLSYLSLKINNDVENKGVFMEDIFSRMLEVKKDNIPLTERYIINNGFNEINVEFSFSIVQSPKKNDYWNFTSKNDESLKESLLQVECYELKDIAEVCVGIKTTADNVFVHPMTKVFVEYNKFEQELIYPLLQSSNVSRWMINWDPAKGKYILYPHTIINGKTVGVDIDNFPNSKKYLYENREQLEGRSYLVESGNRKWYECWVPQKLDKFLKQKIVTKDITEKNSFALDKDGFLCQGNTFFINVRESCLSEVQLPLEKMNLYLLGILNSNVLEFYQKTISGSLYSKKVRYTTSNLNRWIIPKINKENKKVIESIIDIVGNIIQARNANPTLENDLNRIVYDLFGMTEQQREQIEGYLKMNT